MHDAELAHMKQMARDFPRPPGDICIYVCAHNCHPRRVIRPTSAFPETNLMRGQRPACPECKHPANQVRMTVEYGRWVQEAPNVKRLVHIDSGELVVFPRHEDHDVRAVSDPHFLRPFCYTCRSEVA